jgi:cytochrome c-type biogenesis protein CcmH
LRQNRQAWPGLQVEVFAPAGYEAPTGAVLFVIVRNPNAPSPPLGVQRIANPVFPVSARLTDQNSMMAAAPISGVSTIEVIARLSLSGNPSAGENDLESQAVNTEIDRPDAIALELSAP